MKTSTEFPRNHASTAARSAARLIASSAIAITSIGLVIACGGSEEGDDVPQFGGFSTAGTGGQVSGVGGSTGLSSGGPNGLGGSPAGVGGSVATGAGGTTSADVPPPSTITMPCTPNTTICSGNGIGTCDSTGTTLTTLACPTNSVCNTATGIPSCQALPPPTCAASTTFCDSANVIGTCNAEGNAFTTERCPDGTNCTGAGVCTPVACNQQAMLSVNGGGGVTVYWFGQGTLSNPPQAGQDVNCSFGATRMGNDTGANDRVAYIQDPALFGALNFQQYANGAACGACVEVSGPAGRSVITIADSCNPALNNPTCTNGHIDLSRAAFTATVNQESGDVNGISWRFVPCDNVDNVQFLLKEPQNQYWNQFLVVGTRYPIVKAEVRYGDGTWVEAQRESFNYWTPQRGMPDGDMGTYRVRVTDINGSIVEEQLALAAGLQGGTGQFGCQ